MVRLPRPHDPAEDPSSRRQGQGRLVAARQGTYATARSGPLVRAAGLLSARARRRRYATFVQVLGVRPGDRIVDVGCGREGLLALDRAHEIVGIDVRPQPEYPGRLVVANARALPFADGEFDVAYCNSLIEHIDPADRPVVAAEIRRVARRWFVQTPNLWFPLDPHTLLPGYQFLPAALQQRVSGVGAAGSYERVRLLDAAELRRLFPGARIIRERAGPLTKSLIAAGSR